MQLEDRDAQMAGLALGTFNVCLLVLAIVLPLFLAGELGDLLADLSTAIGLGVFGLLWVVTCFCTYKAIREAAVGWHGRIDLVAILRASFAWGAYNGIIVFNCLLAAAIVFAAIVAVTEGGIDNPFGLLVFGVLAFGVGTIVASFIGGVLGMVFGLVNALLLKLSRLAVS